MKDELKQTQNSEFITQNSPKAPSTHHSKFTEAKLEEAIISLLGAEGYPHVLGETIERQPQEVLIKADLRTFLARQYAKDGITPGEIESVIQKLDAYSSADLYESNKAIMRLVSEGFHLKREPNNKSFIMTNSDH